jgi:flagellar motor switch protein FliN/FliY
MSSASGPEPGERTGPETRPTAPAAAVPSVGVKAPEFADLKPRSSGQGANPLDGLLDVNVKVTVELGRATLSIQEVLKLEVGSVVELNRLIFEPVDLMVQGVRLARGEVVVVDDHFAIRIKEITDPKKRS